MKFKSGTRRKAIEYEKDWVERWKQDQTFEKSVQKRSKENSYVFYDGPPFISGVPHHGTLLSSIVKDAVPRYQTMLGKRVERVWGWDCHGLPAERYTEQKLGIHSREEVLKFGIKKYILACQANMVQTSSEWEDVVDRIGRWVEFRGAYKTMDKQYMESVWWAFKTLYEKEKIFEGERVLMYCTLDATPLSKAEVTMDAGAYKDVTDPSVYVLFKLEDGRNLLVWTTTPWTLPANVGLAVNKNFEYVEVEVGKERFILAKNLIPSALTDEKHNVVEHKILNTLKGDSLLGLKYRPLLGVDRGENAHQIWQADYVDLESGTGIVHIAPAYGEEDFALSKEKNMPVVHVIDENGYYTEGEWKGQNVWDTNKPIAKSLKEKGIVWKIEYYRHSYPHCHRCGTRLMYRAHPSWFIDIDGQRELMLEKNGPIYWFPEHVKNGRFAKTIEQAPDWNISRDRFWATAMPVWKGIDDRGKEHVKVVGSYSELKELSGQELDDYHRPWIDDVTFEINGVTYKRIDKVLDSWFEAGSMPFAQFHYPFENKKKFEENFPGDFIVEYVGQVRAWFYYMHAMSVALFGENSFKNVIVTGNIAGNDGRKMSKSYGNYTDPNELMDKFSADSLRFLLLSSPLLNGEDFSLQDKDVGDVARKLSMIWNMYDFFTMYAEVDGWEYDGHLRDPLEECSNPLDIWIISRLHQLVKAVEDNMDAYDIPNALAPVLPFLDDASNWFVRRSRRRFWKSEDDSDKQLAYRTLHYVLVRLCYVLAPFTPFLAEELYHKLTGDNESIHLKDWMSSGRINELVMNDMDTVRSYVNQGLSLRAKEGIKVRQPLACVSVPTLGNHVDFGPILLEELNVKTVKKGQDISMDTKLTDELIQEGLAREIIRAVQNARKHAGLNVDDRIELSLQTESEEVKKSIKSYKQLIQAETLAIELSDIRDGFNETVSISGYDLGVIIKKA